MCLLLNQYGGNLSQWFALSHHQTLVINKSVKNNCSFIIYFFYYWKIFAKFAIVHLELNAVKITYFQYEHHCNHYLPRSGHKKSGHTKLRHRTRSHLGVPLIKKDVSAVLIPSMWNIPRNETPNIEEIFVRVVCIDSPSQCDNGWDRSCGTNSHIPRTYRPRQHPHFAAALHTCINFQNIHVPYV